MIKKTVLFLVIAAACFLVLPVPGFAQTERITLTTYYPSPVGVFNELRARRATIGDNYYLLPWDDDGGGPEAGEIHENTDLAVEGLVMVGTVDNDWGTMTVSREPDATNTPAIYGLAIPSVAGNSYGVGVEGESANTGIFGRAHNENATDGAIAVGGRFQASSYAGGGSRGIEAFSWGGAEPAAVRWAGYFGLAGQANSGRVYIKDLLGLGTETPLSVLDVAGGAVIGSNYAGVEPSPTNGLLVEGMTGINVAGYAATQGYANAGNFLNDYGYFTVYNDVNGNPTLRGMADVAGGYGVWGQAINGGYGVMGVIDSGAGYGVSGVCYGDQSSTGVYAYTQLMSLDPAVRADAFYGYAYSQCGPAYGLFVMAGNSDADVTGISKGIVAYTFGVPGGQNDWAGWFGPEFSPDPDTDNGWVYVGDGLTVGMNTVDAVLEQSYAFSVYNDVDRTKLDAAGNPTVVYADNDGRAINPSAALIQNIMSSQDALQILSVEEEPYGAALDTRGTWDGNASDFNYSRARLNIYTDEAGFWFDWAAFFGEASPFGGFQGGNVFVGGNIYSGSWANWYTCPDYVFEPDYKLMGLADLRKYLAEKKHLPGLQSADEIKQQGSVNLTENSNKHLEKIEEAYLYILQLEERIGALEQKLSKLEQSQSKTGE